MEVLCSKQVRNEIEVLRDTSQIKYSNSSYIVVQDDMLAAEMTDRINEMEIIYEEPSVNEISVELARGKCLAPIAEETTNLTGDEKCLKKETTGHSVEIIRRSKNFQSTNKVSL